MTFLAHSARPKLGVPEQAYAEHIGNVVNAAVMNADRAAQHSSKYGELLRAAVRRAAEFHDLGKLDDLNQDVLRANRGRLPLPLNHVDAGVAHLLKDARSGSELLAAITVFAHHGGLPGWPSESTRGAGRVLRNAEPTRLGVTLNDLSNQRLDQYRNRHAASVAELPPSVSPGTKLEVNPLLWRVALSCLVDADHSDTARHYGDPVVGQSPPLLDAARRLRRLDDYVAKLGRSRTDGRSELRAQIYQQCRDAPCSAGLVACDSPVGSGKTTEVSKAAGNAAKS